MDSLIQPGILLADRYHLLYPLGEGGSGFTYAALDQHTKTHMALKLLSHRRVQDWKQLDLFEREARTLQHLHHPGIPRYFGYHTLQYQGSTLFAISQELAPGQSLAAWIKTGWQPREAQVQEIAKQILEILVYLQQLIPPVIHRDLKPHNIIYNDSEQATQLYLVDFGAVQETIHAATLGSTVIGTFGYMAPEQFRGHANLTTDLYGLGTTLIYLLTQQHPTDLPHRYMKIDFRSQVQLSDFFAEWLDKLIEPNSQDRFPTAAVALKVLTRQLSLAIVKPVQSQVSLVRTQHSLQITIPAAIRRQSTGHTSLKLWLASWLGGVGLPLYLVLSVFNLSSIWGAIYIALEVLHYFRGFLWTHIVVLLKLMWLGALYILSMRADEPHHSIHLLVLALDLIYGIPLVWKISDQVLDLLLPLQFSIDSSGLKLKQGSLRYLKGPLPLIQVENQGAYLTLRVGPRSINCQSINVGYSLTPNERTWLAFEIQSLISQLNSSPEDPINPLPC